MKMISLSGTRFLRCAHAARLLGMVSVPLAAASSTSFAASTAWGACCCVAARWGARPL